MPAWKVFFNKVGAFYNFFASMYWDQKIAQGTKELSKTLAPCRDDATSCQSISYPLLRHALKCVDLSHFYHLIDIGAGFGRLLLYVQHVHPEKKLEGYEINKKAFLIAKELCQPKGITIKNKDIFSEFLHADLFILFNPFTGKSLARFLNQLSKGAPTTVLYINLYNDHLQALDGLTYINYQVTTIHKPLLGIDNKLVAVINISNNSS